MGEGTDGATCYICHEKCWKTVFEDGSIGLTRYIWIHLVDVYGIMVGDGMWS